MRKIAIRTKWKFIVEFEDEETWEIAGTIGQAGTREECEALIEDEMQEQRFLGRIVVNAEAAEICAQCDGEGGILLEDDIVAICDACGGRIGPLSRFSAASGDSLAPAATPIRSHLRAAS
jgi:hypothetical protein